MLLPATGRRCLSHPRQGSGFLSFKLRVVAELRGLHTSTPCFIGSWLHVHFASEHPCLLSSDGWSSNDMRRGTSPGTISM